MTIKDLLNIYRNNYSNIYDGIISDNTVLRLAMNYGDLLLKQLELDPEGKAAVIIDAMVKEMHDFFVSDREIQALGLTLKDFL